MGTATDTVDLSADMPRRTPRPMDPVDMDMTDMAENTPTDIVQTSDTDLDMVVTDMVRDMAATDVVLDTADMDMDLDIAVDMVTINCMQHFT